MKVNKGGFLSKNIKSNSNLLSSYKSDNKLSITKKKLSTSEKLSLNKMKNLEKVLLKKFIKLPKEKIEKTFKEVREPSIKFYPKNLSIEDKLYRTILKKNIKTIENNNSALNDLFKTNSSKKSSR